MSQWERSNPRRQSWRPALVGVAVTVAALGAALFLLRIVESPRPLVVEERSDSDVGVAVTASPTPPPTGAVVVEGVWLQRTAAPSRAQCRSLAGRVGYPVPCPKRLPAPAQADDCGGSGCIVRRTRASGRQFPGLVFGVVIQQQRVPMPGQSPWLGLPRDVVITAVPLAAGGPREGALRLTGPRELVSCFPEGRILALGRRVLRSCVHARPFVRGQGGYPLQRHTAAVWRRRDVVYAVGVEGAGEHIEALVAAIVKGIEYVEPL